MERMQKKLEKKKQRAILKMQNKMDIEEGDRRKKDTQRAIWSDPKFEGEQRRRKIQKKRLTRGQKGDADRAIVVKKPKHLFSGKLGRGKRDRR